MGKARWSGVRGVLAVGAVSAILAAVPAWAQPKSHAGEFVKSGEGQFSMTMGGQNEHVHKVNDQTRYTLNGKAVPLGELKPGDLIAVTTENGNVLAVDAIRPAAKTGP